MIFRFREFSRLCRQEYFRPLVGLRVLGAILIALFRLDRRACPPSDRCRGFGASPQGSGEPSTASRCDRPSASVWESRRRFQFCVERFQSIRRLFLSLRNFVILAARQPEPHNGQPRGYVPYLVGSRLPRPYHFAARIQSFQAIAAPFPGASFFSQPLAPRSRRPNRLGSKARQSPRRSPLRRRPRNKHRTTTQLWQEIC